MVLITGLTYLPFGNTAEAWIYHVLLILSGTYLLFRDELKQKVVEYRSKRSDRTRRQHLRDVLKRIDAEAVTQREERSRVAVELESLEPQPTYRIARERED
jgi:hypothetical protein